MEGRGEGLYLIFLACYICCCKVCVVQAKLDFCNISCSCLSRQSFDVGVVFWRTKVFGLTVGLLFACNHLRLPECLSATYWRCLTYSFCNLEAFLNVGFESICENTVHTLNILNTSSFHLQ